MVGEFERAVAVGIGGGEVGGALQVEGVAGGGVGEEAPDVVLDQGDEGEDGVDVWLLFEVESGGGGRWRGSHGWLVGEVCLENGN